MEGRDLHVHVSLEFLDDPPPPKKKMKKKKAAGGGGGRIWTPTSLMHVHA